MCANHAVCYDYFDLLPGWMEELSGVFFALKSDVLRIASSARTAHSNYFYNPWIVSSVCAREQSCTQKRDSPKC
jgi:hypothetical protein